MKGGREGGEVPFHPSIHPSVTTHSLTHLDDPSIHGLQCCNHPYLLSDAEYTPGEEMVQASGKLRLLDRMLPKLKVRVGTLTDCRNRRW